MPRKKQQTQRLGRRTSKKSGPDADELARIALDLFAERHFDSVSIRDIGRAANINSAMSYYYYEDKAALFCAAIESAIDEAFALFAKHCDTGKHETPAEAISAWFDVHVALHKRLRNVIKISLDCKGIVGTVPEANEPIKRFYRHEKEILQKLIHEGIRDGLFHKVDSAVVATMISTILDGVLARSIFLKDFEMVKTVGAFKQAILLYLGYQRPAQESLSRALRKVGA